LRKSFSKPVEMVSIPPSQHSVYVYNAVLRGMRLFAFCRSSTADHML